MNENNLINSLMRSLGGRDSSRQTSVKQDPGNSLIKIVVDSPGSNSSRQTSANYPIQIVVDSGVVPGKEPAELPVHPGQGPAELPVHIGQSRASLN